VRKPWCKHAAVKSEGHQLSVKLCAGQETLAIHYPALVPANPRQYGVFQRCFRVENDFTSLSTSFENWFRCMHNVRMVQLIMQGSIEDLKRLYDDANQSSESEIKHTFDLFRSLASDIIDEADHQETRCREF